jgi:hypothetical protein
VFPKQSTSRVNKLPVVLNSAAAVHIHILFQGEGGTGRGVRWVGNVARMGDIRNAYYIFVEKPEGKRPLGRPRCR